MKKLIPTVKLAVSFVEIGLIYGLLACGAAWSAVTLVGWVFASSETLTIALSWAVCTAIALAWFSNTVHAVLARRENRDEERP